MSDDDFKIYSMANDLENVDNTTEDIFLAKLEMAILKSGYTESQIIKIDSMKGKLMKVKGYYSTEEIHGRVIELTGKRWCMKKIKMLASYPDFPKRHKSSEVGLFGLNRSYFYKADEIDRYILKNKDIKVSSYYHQAISKRPEAQDIPPAKTVPKNSMFRSRIIKQANEFYRILNAQKAA